MGKEKLFLIIYFILFFNFTILYWFCHKSINREIINPNKKIVIPGNLYTGLELERILVVPSGRQRVCPSPTMIIQNLIIKTLQGVSPAVPTRA